MPRLFVAIDIPDEVKEQLTALCSGINGARWVKPEQMHLTLYFIGKADQTQAEIVKFGLGAVKAAPFTFYMKGIGQFPLKGNPRVIWVGVQAPAELELLQKQVEAIVVKLGHQPAELSFSPHITLARLKSPAHDLRHYFDRHATFEGAEIRVSHFGLYSSNLTPQGSIYRREATFPL